MEDLYRKYNYPSAGKLYEIAKREGIKTTHKQIKEFLSKQHVSQVFRKDKPKKGFIVAFSPEERVQMDLIDVSKFSQKNKGFSWILLIVDIFTRKVITYLLKKKDIESIEDALMEYFDEHHPDVVTSDNESAFKSKIIQKLMLEYDVQHSMVDVGDHKALGVIDRAVQTIKNAIYKYMKDKNTTSYHEELPRIVEAYNDTPNDGILGLTPNEASQKNNVVELQILNHKKARVNASNRGTFAVGDTVRIRNRKTAFARSYDETYSDEVFTISALEERYAVLDDGQRVSLRRLVKSQETERKNERDELKEAKRVAKIDRIMRREDLAPIVEGKRVRKPKRFADE
jgi:transposase InsO family protein